jgi:hypothetical protein
MLWQIGGMPTLLSLFLTSGRESKRKIGDRSMQVKEASALLKGSR